MPQIAFRTSGVVAIRSFRLPYRPHTSNNVQDTSAGWRGWHNANFVLLS